MMSIEKRKLLRGIGVGVVFALTALLLYVCVLKQFFIVPLAAGALLIGYLLLFRVNYFMYLLALLTPFSIIITDERFNIGLSLPAEVMMIAVTLLLFVRLIFDLKTNRKIALHPLSIAIYIYLAWLLITAITSELPLISFKFLASKIWFIGSSYFVVIQLMKHDFRHWQRIFNCYAVGLAVVVIISSVRLLMYGLHTMHYIMHPFYNDHTAYGAVLAFFLPFTILFTFSAKNRPMERLFYGCLSLIFAGGLFCSFSRAAWISVVFAFGVWVVLKWRIKLSWLFAAMLLIFSTLFYFSDDIIYQMSRNSQDSSGKIAEQLQSITNISTDASNVERLNRWTAAFGLIRERPLMGWGPGTYQFVYAPYQKSAYHTIITTDFGDGGNAHSEYIGPCAETGFIGLATVLLMFGLALYYAIITFIRATDSRAKVLSLAAALALSTYYLHGVLNNFLDTDKLSLPFWSTFALITMLHLMFVKKEKITIS